MGAWVWIVIAVVAIVVLAAAMSAIVRRRRRRELRDWFGPDHAHSDQPARSRLQARDKRVDRAEPRRAPEIQALTQEARARYAARWNQLQERFGGRPRVVVLAADDLITEVMRDCGYPVDDFESKPDLVSVEHRDVVQTYRDAHSVYRKTTTSEASTEDLRRAVIAYRVLFEELVTGDAGSGDGRARP
jgi:hypothetical protein